ncbi:unnamed protein product, partial [Linum tenue]
PTTRSSLSSRSTSSATSTARNRRSRPTDNQLHLGIGEIGNRGGLVAWRGNMSGGEAAERAARPVRWCGPGKR